MARIKAWRDRRSAFAFIYECDSSRASTKYGCSSSSALFDFGDRSIGDPGFALGTGALLKCTTILCGLMTAFRCYLQFLSI